MGVMDSTIKLSSLLPVLETITDAAFVDDANGICIWCNTAVEEIYMESREKFYGKTVDELVSLGIFTQSVTKVVLEQKEDKALIHENKSGRRLLTSGYPVFTDDGDISFIVTISKDITGLTTKGSKPNRPGNKLLDVTQMNKFDVKEDQIVAASQAMKNVLVLTRRLSAVDTPVLLIGESGVGKSRLAETLHDESKRSGAPFMHVNCDAIADTMIEAELFGYVRGTFTGTRAEGNKGVFESASGGTVFLDEISELSLNAQFKVLRVIRDGIIQRVGSIRNIPVDVRIIAATSKDLMELVKSGRFRDDFYYSLNVAPISVPALRDRPEDILQLIQRELNRFNGVLGEDKELGPDALTVLLKYTWPGNIRELQNIIERLILTTEGQVIHADNIPTYLRENAEININTNTDMSLQSAMEQAEKEILASALKAYGSTRAMAKVLQVSQPTIVRKLNKYGLSGSRSE